MTSGAAQPARSAHSTLRPADWLALCCWIALPLAAGLVGGIASVAAPRFYLSLLRPAWAPPAWLFGPVWTVLYLMMGVAAWLVSRASAGGPRRRALLLFVLQLVPNAAWTWLFFWYRSGAAAFADILLLWAAIALMVAWFARLRRVAAWLVLPYWAWVSDATALSWVLWRANPGLR